MTFDSDSRARDRARLQRHPARPPFADGEDGNRLAADMAPARNGIPGR
ncbi:hypothetical protein [Streptomonospora alba]|nr:hypothetical protein [Streptomonospora alba]